ncbi:MAG: methyltransferase [Tatlockia sp.]|nr:methyltransferase [Tatlockia sp.]
MQTRMENPHIQLVTMSRWYVVSRAIHAIAKLGLANHMSLESMKIDDLAELSGTQPELLARLLKFLSIYGLFNCDGISCSLTELSFPLRDDAPNSVSAVMNMVDDSWWQAFSNIDKSLKTGGTAFVLEHGEDFFTYLSKNLEKQANYDKGMARLSSFEDEAIAKSFDFSQFLTLIVIRGGQGGLAKAIAQNNPSLELIIFDKDAVISELKKEDLSEKISLVSGDFFAEIPKAEAYIFKGVLHDFNDQTMHEILSNCRKQMPNNASLFIAEQALPDDDKPHPNKTMDIVMMVLLGGKQRRVDEWIKSVELAGFSFHESYKTDSLFTLLEFKPN